MSDSQNNDRYYASQHKGAQATIQRLQQENLRLRHALEVIVEDGYEGADVIARMALEDEKTS